MKAFLVLALSANLQAAAKPAEQEPPKAVQSRDEILKQDIENALKKLGSERHTESYVARVELEDLGRRVVPAVVAELNKPDLKPAVKRNLCEILGAIRDPHKDAVAALTAKLKDPDEWGTSIAAAAAAALASIGDDSAVPALLETLKSRRSDSDRVLKHECIRAMGLFRSKDAVEPLKKALEDKKAATVSDDDTQGVLIATAAADALGLIRAGDAVEDLGKLLSDTTMDPRTQQPLGVHAARALQRILEHELRGKGEKDEPRAGALAGEAKDVGATHDAWKKWWASSKAKKDIVTAREKLGKLATAVEAYKKAHGKLPGILVQLKTNPDIKDFPKDGYWKDDLKDPWGMEFQFRPTGTGAEYDLFSYGPDKTVWGGGDNADLWNHDKWKEIKKAESKKAVEEAVKLINQFKADQDRYPEKIYDLSTRPLGYVLKKWPEKGYSTTVPKDGFDNYLIYRAPGTGGEPFDLVSPGANKAEGADDKDIDEDLWNHDKRPPKKEEPKKDEPKKDEKK